MKCHVEVDCSVLRRVASLRYFQVRHVVGVKMCFFVFLVGLGSVRLVCGMAWHGMAWRGMAWHGVVWCMQYHMQYTTIKHCLTMQGSVELWSCLSSGLKWYCRLCNR